MKQKLKHRQFVGKDNKLIAEFMGHKTNWGFKKDSILYMPQGEGNSSSNSIVVPYKKLQYHTSWDWLMPVVEKIESLGYELMIAESRCKINHNTDYSIEEVINIDIIGSKREATYQAVVWFIQEYNLTPKEVV